jgi:hypothetical protein
MAFLPHHSPSSDHELLLRDFQGQENDHERQEEDELSWAENDKTSEDGGEQEKKKQGNHIYARQLAGAGRSRTDHLEDIKSEHQDHHFSVSDVGDTKEVQPYHHHYYYSYSVPLLDVKVRRFVYIGLMFHLPTSSSFSTSSTSSFCSSALLNTPSRFLSLTCTNTNTNKHLHSLLRHCYHSAYHLLCYCDQL